MTPLEQVDFAGLRIRFDERVLRPRPWTAAQSRWATELLATAPGGAVLELCTGAGQLGLLAVADTDRRLVAVDADPVAVRFARDNAAAAGLRTRVEVREGQLDRVLAPDEEFAMVLADPPWVRHAAVRRFPEDPVAAIDGGVDGLDLARRCLAVAERHLSPGGSALLQLGSVEQAARVDRELRTTGHLTVVEVRDRPGQGVLVRVDRVSPDPVS
ncbi:MAG TPA: methyltransferase [Segeticoccus sp.]|jgi:release factor glutamine methyltransferase|nr:methyltransferase [Segeticoccus sp.]